VVGAVVIEEKQPGSGVKANADTDGNPGTGPVGNSPVGACSD
jgi:hypothetical protein